MALPANGLLPIPSTTLSLSGISTTFNNVTVSTSSNAAMIFPSKSGNQPAIQIHAGENHVLEIWADGRITWTGSLAKSTRIFLKYFRNHIDLDVAGERAMMSSYRKGLEHSLQLAESMSKKDLLLALKSEIDARISKEVINELSNDDQKEE